MPGPASPPPHRFDRPELLVGVSLVLLGYLAASPGALLRPLWLDEVATLWMAGFEFEPRWPLVRADVHPPGYVVLASAARAIPAAAARPELARALNLAFVLPFTLGLGLVWRALGRGPACLAALLLLSTRYAGGLLFELRAYMPMLALSFLLSSLAFLGPRRGRLWGLGLTAVALSSLHYFGLASAVATLFVSAGWDLRAGHGRSAKTQLGLIGVLLLLFAGWLASCPELLDGLESRAPWRIVSRSTYVRSAVDAAAPLAGLGLLAFPLRKRWDAPTLAVLSPALIVLVVTALMSLIKPVVTPRSLIVLVPNIVLAAALIAHRHRPPRPQVAALVIISLLLATDALRRADDSPEDLGWLIATTHTPACRSVPYFAQLSDYGARALEATFPAVTRPRIAPEALVDVLRTEPERFLTCRELGFGAHNGADAEAIRALFAKAGVPVRIRRPPAGIADSYGFVVALEGR